jgi:hypothetical protein
MGDVAVVVDSSPILVSVNDVAIDVAVAQVHITVASSGPPGPSGGGGGGSGGVIIDSEAPPLVGYDFIWVDADGVDSSGGGGGVSDHGALTGLTDPDHPIAAIQGLEAALASLAPLSHSHTPMAVGAEPAGAVVAHEGALDPHGGYLKPVDIVAGTNITVSTTTDTVTINASGGGGGLDQAAADARYVNVTGDTITGDVTVAHAGLAQSILRSTDDDAFLRPGIPLWWRSEIRRKCGGRSI